MFIAESHQKRACGHAGGADDVPDGMVVIADVDELPGEAAIKNGKYDIKTSFSGPIRKVYGIE